MLTAGALNACNTFEDGEAIAPRPFTESEVRLDGNRVLLTMPPASAAVLTLEQS
jgi:alpha-L-arabinofuranosidase